MQCFFVTDLHGSISRYKKLFKAIKVEKPQIVLLGGDLLPHGMDTSNEFGDDFINMFLAEQFENLKSDMGEDYPEVLVILGNDDYKFHEESVIKHSENNLWHYIHDTNIEINGYTFYGYANVPPTPFLLKDWEVYDVSRYVDPGCISPLEGKTTVEISEHRQKYGTIAEDLAILVPEGIILDKSVFLFHSPPHKTFLDRAALDGKIIDFVPLDPNVGSIAIRRFIETRQPLLTLHGHIHESSEITGFWRDKVGKTEMFSAAYSGKELSLIKFDLNNLQDAIREIL